MKSERQKASNRKYAFKYREENPLHVALYNDLYRLVFGKSVNKKRREKRVQDGDYIREREASWRKNNRDRHLDNKRKFYCRNRFKCLARIRKWSDSNRDKVRLIASRYASKLRVAACQSTIYQQKEVDKIYARAQHLRQWFDVVVDHIKPLSKGGNHSPGNLQIIYRSENLRKSARIDYEPQIIFR